jgi:hypothetical protein
MRDASSRLGRKLAIFRIAKLSGLIWFAGFVFATSSEGAQLGGNDAPALPAELLARLNQQARQMGVATFEFDEQGTSVANDYGGDLSYSVYIEGDRFHSRKRILRGRDGTPSAAIHDDSLDRRTFYFGHLNGASGIPAALWKYSVANLKDFDYVRTMVEIPYLDAIGFYLPRSIAEMSEFTSVLPLAKRYMTNIVGVQSVDGNWEIVLSVPDSYLLIVRALDLEEHEKELAARGQTPEFVADLIETYKRLRSLQPIRKVRLKFEQAHGYALSEREEWTAAGQRILLTSGTDWKYYAVADLWLPKRCVASFFTNPHNLNAFEERPVRTTVTLLKKVEFGPRQHQFDLEKTPEYQGVGTVVVDRAPKEVGVVAGEPVTHTIGAGGANLPGLVLDIPSNNIPPKTRWPYRLAAAAALAVLLSLTLTAAFRRLKKRPE